MGLPPESELLAAWCRASGRAEVPPLDFHVVFSLFRLSAILQGVVRRGLEGHASSTNAGAYPPVVSALADAAWEIASRAR
jgi:aminoglycoside phosphotransferase (APT) family kinase protein